MKNQAQTEQMNSLLYAINPPKTDGTEIYFADIIIFIFEKTKECEDLEFYNINELRTYYKLIGVYKYNYNFQKIPKSINYIEIKDNQRINSINDKVNYYDYRREFILFESEAQAYVSKMEQLEEMKNTLITRAENLIKSTNNKIGNTKEAIQFAKGKNPEYFL